jgi:hypothetical protein
MMANRTANLRAIPGVLAETIQTTLALSPSSEGQKTAQREMATALGTALDARRQRIIISQSQVNLLSDCNCDGSQRRPARIYRCDGNL